MNWVGPLCRWVSKVKIWFADGFVCWQAQGGTYGGILMQSIKVFAYICFGLATVGLLIALAEEPEMLAPALVLFVTGVLLTALDKIITTLVEIRDALTGKSDIERREPANVKNTETGDKSQYALQKKLVMTSKD